MKQGLVLITVLLLGLCGCSLQDAPRSAEESMAVEESMTIEETRHICLPSGTAAREDCALCGSRSIWSYYSKLDSIGVLNLASGDINNLRIFEYEDDGTRRDNSGHSSMMIANDGDERYSHMTEVIF